MTTPSTIAPIEKCLVTIEAGALTHPNFTESNGDSSGVLILLFRTERKINGKQLLFTNGFRTTRCSRSRYRTLLKTIGETRFLAPETACAKLIGKRLRVTIESYFDGTCGVLYQLRRLESVPEKTNGKREPMGCQGFNGHVFHDVSVGEHRVCGQSCTPSSKYNQSAPAPVQHNADSGRSRLCFLSLENMPRERKEELRDGYATEKQELDEDVNLSNEVLRAAAEVLILGKLLEREKNVTRADQNRRQELRLVALRFIHGWPVPKIAKSENISEKTAYRKIKRLLADLGNVDQEYMHISMMARQIVDKVQEKAINENQEGGKINDITSNKFTQHPYA